MPPARLSARPAPKPADRLRSLRPSVELRTEDMGMTITLWSHLPITALTNWQPQPFTAPSTGRLKSGGRVVLTKTGTVSYERSGFALVRWDDGTESLCWSAELKEAA